MPKLSRPRPRCCPPWSSDAPVRSGAVSAGQAPTTMPRRIVSSGFWPAESEPTAAADAADGATGSKAVRLAENRVTAVDGPRRAASAVAATWPATAGPRRPPMGCAASVVVVEVGVEVAGWASRCRRRPRPGPCAGGPCVGLSGA